MRTAIEQAGATLRFLPPYSPDLNPIEQVFAKLKAFLRHAAERTVEATWRRVGTLLDRFGPEEMPPLLHPRWLCLHLKTEGSSCLWLTTGLTRQGIAKKHAESAYNVIREIGWSHFRNDDFQYVELHPYS